MLPDNAVHMINSPPKVSILCNQELLDSPMNGGPGDGEKIMRRPADSYELGILAQHLMLPSAEQLAHHGPDLGVELFGSYPLVIAFDSVAGQILIAADGTVE